MRIDERSSKALQELRNLEKDFEQELTLELVHMKSKGYYNATLRSETPTYVPSILMSNSMKNRLGTSKVYVYFDNKRRYLERPYEDSEDVASTVNNLSNFFEEAFNGNDSVIYTDENLENVTQEVVLDKEPSMNKIANKIENIERHYALSNFYLDGEPYIRE